MSQELQLSQSLQQTIEVINKQTSRAKSGGRSFRSNAPNTFRKEDRDKTEEVTLEGIGRYNLSPDYQHVKSQFMDT